MAESAETLRVPLLSLAASQKIVVDQTPGGRGKTRKWVFKFAQNDSLAAERLLRAMQHFTHQRVALLYSTDPFGKSGAEVFKEELRKSAGQSLAHEGSFAAELDRPESVVAAIPTNVQAIVIWGTAPGPAVLMQELKRTAHPAQVYLSHGNASRDFIRSAGPSCEGAIVVGSRVLLKRSLLNSKNPADAVIESYHQLWDRHRLEGTPSHFGGHARDALMLLADIVQHGTAISRESIRDELEGTRNWEGVTGRFTFEENDHAGLTLDSFETFQIRNGDFEPFEPHK